MKRLQEVIKPFLSIIFGALLLLYYMNWMQGNGMYLAMGIIAVVLATYYLGVGVVGLVVGNKLPPSLKKVFDLCSLIIFPTFIFIVFLLSFISFTQNWGVENVGPTGWTLLILKLAASIGFAVVFLVAWLVKNKVLDRIALVFAATFVLALLCEVLFDITGDSVGLGGIVIVEFVLYFIYCNMLLSSIRVGGEKKAAAEPEEEPAEEEPEEEAEAEEPAEEKPAEEE